MIFVNACLYLCAKFYLPQAEELAFIGLMIAVAAIPLPIAYRYKTMAAGGGIVLSSILHILFYHFKTGLRFSLFQIIDNPLEAFESIGYYFGRLGTFAVFFEFFATAALMAWILLVLRHRIPTLSRSVMRVAYVLAAIPCVLYGSQLVAYRLVSPNPMELHFEGEARADLPKANGETLIVVQLESVNGRTLFGPLAKRIQFPALEQVKKLGGSWLPQIWANSFGTNLGMSSIACGASGAMVSQLVSPPDGVPCMPERFRRAGYGTTFYYSFRDAEFYKIKNHVKKIGFENFIFGPKLMRPEDPFYKTGYEDCRFYDRALADMHERKLDQSANQFIYLSVHMNHFPFTQHLAGIEHPFPAARSGSQEEYLNSAIEQDYCLGHFIEKVAAWNRDDVNLMAVGDHSIPFANPASIYGNYQTSFYFVPSRARAKEFKAGEIHGLLAAQDQIGATAVELMGGPTSDASFLWGLKGDPQPSTYRTCQVVSYFGFDMGFVTNDGKQFVTRWFRQKKFFGDNLGPDGRLVSTELVRPSDWERVTIPKDCLARLGIK